MIGYDKKWREYTIHLTPAHHANNRELLFRLMKIAYDFNSRE